jgi:phage gp37-like protein
VIKTIEDNLIALVNATLPNVLRVVQSVPGQLTEQVLKAMFASAPAVYVAFLGGRNKDAYSWTASFAVYAVTGQGDQDQRRSGDARVIGAYDIMQALIPTINNHTVTDVGTLRFERVQNLFNLALDKQGLTVYPMTFNIDLSMEYRINTDTLNAFVTYHAEHSLVPGNNEPAAIDNVTLEQ